MRKLIFRLAAAALAALAASEIGLRGADALRGRGFFSEDRLRLLDGSLYTAPRQFCQFRPPPGARYRVSGSEIRINSLGLRGEEVSRAKPSGAFRILCLGGSTTFDAFNGAGDHWPHLLQEALRWQFPERKIEVLNAGVNGWSTAHSLAYLAFDGLALSPDLVVVHHNVNDLSVNFHGEPLPDYSNKYGLPEWDPDPGRHRSGLDRVLGWSQSYLYLRLLGRQVHREARFVEVKPYPKGAGLPAAVQFRRNLESICAVAGAQRVAVLLGVEPEDILRHFNRTVVTQLGLGGTVQVPDAETYRKFHAEYSAIIRDVAARQGARLADADRFMSGRAEHFVDTCHTTLAGSEALAEIYRAAIAPLVAASPPLPQLEVSPRP